MPAGYLGIDVGGTKVALRVETDGDDHREHSFRWANQTAEEDLSALARNVRLLQRDWGGSFASVGVALPATVDTGGRVAAWPSRPSWTGLDIAGALRDVFPGIAVSCADDGDLAALAEAEDAGAANIVYVGVGTGIGGGIVLDGRPCPGLDRGSCEIGHVVIDRAGPLCVCGRRGCVQAMASGPAMLRRAGEIAGREVTFDELRAAWSAREAWALDAIGDGAAAIATAVVGVAELVHPELAVIGGGFADGIAGFVDAVADHVGRLARQGHPATPVRRARLGGLSSLRGAVLLARRAP